MVTENSRLDLGNRKDSLVTEILGWIWVTEMTLWLPKFSAGFAISVSTEAEDEELAIGGVVVEGVRAAGGRSGRGSHRGRGSRSGRGSRGGRCSRGGGLELNVGSHDESGGLIVMEQLRRSAAVVMAAAVVVVAAAVVAAAVGSVGRRG